MASLLSLPRELRDDIWEKACHNAFPPFGSPPVSHHLQQSPQLLQSCRQIYHEAAPYVYETTVLKLSHPLEALRWIRSIGSRNSACICHLVLQFSSLSAADQDDQPRLQDTWSAALQLLPKLQTLTFNYQPKNGNDADDAAGGRTRPAVVPAPTASPGAGGPLTLPEPATVNLQRTRNPGLEWSDVQPDYHFQSVTHAFLAVHEPMPSILVLYFAKLLKLSSASSLEQNITCLPTDFLAGHGFYPTRTYALTEGPPSIAFTYRKQDTCPRSTGTTAPNLELMLSQLSQLSYLRLGCHQVDSSILSAIPAGIKTLDVAFADSDPARVARNLHAMRSRCTRLFTLTIAISPLHDDRPIKETESLADVESRLAAEAEVWEPFWRALEDIQNTGVRVYEGEGARFRKFTRQSSAPPRTLQLL